MKSLGISQLWSSDSSASSAYEAINGPPSLLVMSSISSRPLSDKHSSSLIGVKDDLNGASPLYCFTLGGVKSTCSTSSLTSTSNLTF